MTHSLSAPRAPQNLQKSIDLLTVVRALRPSEGDGNSAIVKVTWRQQRGTYGRANRPDCWPPHCTQISFLMRALALRSAARSAMVRYPSCESHHSCFLCFSFSAFPVYYCRNPPVFRFWVYLSFNCFFNGLSVDVRDLMPCLFVWKGCNRCCLGFRDGRKCNAGIESFMTVGEVWVLGFGLGRVDLVLPGRIGFSLFSEVVRDWALSTRHIPKLRTLYGIACHYDLLQFLPMNWTGSAFVKGIGDQCGCRKEGRKEERPIMRQFLQLFAFHSVDRLALRSMLVGECCNWLPSRSILKAGVRERLVLEKTGFDSRNVRCVESSERARRDRAWQEAVRREHWGFGRELDVHARYPQWTCWDALRGRHLRRWHPTAVWVFLAGLGFAVLEGF